MNNTYLTDEDYNFIYSRVPRICVDLLIQNQNGDILLTKRDIEPYKDHWHLPGGRIKFRETVEEALHRIAKGELGYVLNTKHEVLGVCEFLEEEQGGNPRHSLSIVHLIEFHGYGDFKDGEWFKELPSPIIPMQKDFITKYLK